MIVCKSAAELEKMRAANQLVARVLEALRPLVVPGATTGSIDAEAERLVRDAGADLQTITMPDRLWSRHLRGRASATWPGRRAPAR